jgi:hypothetical protein
LMASPGNFGIKHPIFIRKNVFKNSTVLSRKKKSSSVNIER